MMLIRYGCLAKYLSFPCMDCSVLGLGIYPRHQEANQKDLILEAHISLCLRYSWGTKALCCFFAAAGKTRSVKKALIPLSAQAGVSQEEISQKELMALFFTL